MKKIIALIVLILCPSLMAVPLVGNVLTTNTVAAGANITIVQGGGTATISSSGSGSGSIASIQNVVPMASPQPAPGGFGPVITNGQGGGVFTQLSGGDCDGTNTYYVFNHGVAGDVGQGGAPYAVTNWNYPTNGGGSAWTFCGGKFLRGQLYAVANNFVTNVFSTTTTLLYQFNPNWANGSLDLVTIIDLKNGTGVNMEDLVTDPANNSLSIFSFFTQTNGFWASNYVVYNNQTWASNSVFTLSQQVWLGGGMAAGWDGNIYLNGLAYATTAQWPGGSSNYYCSFNPFYSVVSATYNSGFQNVGLWQVNPTNGHVVRFMQPVSGQNGGYGSPLFEWTNGPGGSTNSSAIWLTWNYSCSLGSSQYPFNFNLPGTTTPGFTNNTVAYSLLQTNIASQLGADGLTFSTNALFQNLFCTNINVQTTTSGALQSGATSIGPLNVYGSLNLLGSELISAQAPQFIFSDLGVAGPLGTNSLWCSGANVALTSEKAGAGGGSSISLLPNSASGLTVFSNNATGVVFAAGPGGQYLEELTIDANSNLVQRGQLTVTSNLFQSAFATNFVGTNQWHFVLTNFSGPGSNWVVWTNFDNSAPAFYDVSIRISGFCRTNSAQLAAESMWKEYVVTNGSGGSGSVVTNTIAALTTIGSLSAAVIPSPNGSPGWSLTAPSGGTNSVWWVATIEVNFP